MSNFPVVKEIPVQWGEMDAFQHVNNVVFFRYMESVRIKYFEQTNMMRLMKETQIGPILASCQCRFIRPLTYPDIVRASCGITRIGNTSMTMVYRLETDKTGLVAEGDSVIVMIDYQKGKKVPVPDTLRQHINELEEKALQG